MRILQIYHDVYYFDEILNNFEVTVISVHRVCRALGAHVKKANKTRTELSWFYKVENTFVEMLLLEN